MAENHLPQNFVLGIEKKQKASIYFCIGRFPPAGLLITEKLSCIFQKEFIRFKLSSCEYTLT